MTYFQGRPFDTAAAARRYANGEHLRTIAADLHVQQERVRAACLQHGIPIRDPRLIPRPPGSQAAAMRRHLDVDEIAVQRAADGDQTVQLNLAEREAAVQLLRQRGLNDRRIARRLNVSDRTVLRIRQRLQLTAVA